MYHKIEKGNIISKKQEDEKFLTPNDIGKTDKYALVLKKISQDRESE